MKKTIVAVACALLACAALPLFAADAADAADAAGAAGAAGAAVAPSNAIPPKADKEYFTKGVDAGLQLMRAIEFNNDDQFWSSWNYLYDGTADHYTHFDQPQKGAFWKGVSIAVDSRFSSAWQSEDQRSRFTKITYSYHKDFRPSQSDTWWIVRLIQTQFNQTKDLDAERFAKYCTVDCYGAYDLDQDKEWPKRIMQCYYFWLKTLTENIYIPALDSERLDLDKNTTRKAQILKDAGEAFKMAFNDK